MGDVNFSLYPSSATHISLKDMGIHPMEDRNYGESWFACGISGRGDTFFILLSVTNLGFHKFTTTIDIAYYHGGVEEVFLFHREYKRSFLHFSGGSPEIGVGENTFVFLPQKVTVILKEPDLQGELVILNRGDSYKGVRFDEGKRFLRVMIPILNGEVRGRFLYRGKSYLLDGYAYLSHSITNFLISSLFKSWVTARGRVGEDGIEFQRYVLKRGGGRVNAFLIILKKGKIVKILENPVIGVINKGYSRKCDCSYPAEMVIKDKDVRVRLRRTRIKFYDILAHLSWIERTVVKVFVTSPWKGRVVYEVDMEYGGKHYMGFAVGEMDIFR